MTPHTPTKTTYNAGCRCNGCRTAHAAYSRRWRAGETTMPPALPYRIRIRALMRDGWDQASLADVAGVSLRTIQEISRGARTSVQKATAAELDRLFDIPDGPPTIDAGPLVSALRATGKPITQLLPDPVDSRRFYRAADAGRVDEVWADRIACTVLRMPLELLYGTDYDTEAA